MKNIKHLAIQLQEAIQKVIPPNDPMVDLAQHSVAVDEAAERLLKAIEADKTEELLREALSLALQYVPLDGEDSCKINELVKATTDELSEAIPGPDSEFITYSHIRAPKGPRFRQYRKTKLPAWATDVQPSN
ncbi:MAG: hypothetical protein M0R32_08435 [Candidatus Cloacimonetes bacterium]|jgi:hypothetical protein|nr:hypothetical protein [Candidatus Cloacimonadota bacterium]